MNSYIDFAQYCVSYYKSFTTSREAVPKTYDDLYDTWLKKEVKSTIEERRRWAKLLYPIVLQVATENQHKNIEIFSKKRGGKNPYYRFLYSYLLYVKGNVPISHVSEFYNKEGVIFDKSNTYHHIQAIEHLLTINDVTVIKDLTRIDELIEK